MFNCSASGPLRDPFVTLTLGLAFSLKESQGVGVLSRAAVAGLKAVWAQL